MASRRGGEQRIEKLYRHNYTPNRDWINNIMASKHTRICKTCGTYYSARAMVCPNCHKGFGLERTATATATTTVAPSPTRLIEIHFGQAKELKPLTYYPAWLIRFDEETNKSTYAIGEIARNETSGIARHVAKALLALRFREEIPDMVDMSAIEKEIAAWFVFHNLNDKAVIEK